MKYLIDISQNHIQKINKLIEENQYGGVSQFVAAAIENQLHLEESGIENVSVSGKMKNGFAENTGVIKINPHLNLSDIKSTPKEVQPPVYEKLILSRDGVDDEKNVWLWGQFNKILPVKIGARILFRELGNNEKISLDEFADKAAAEAAVLGDAIRTHEDREGKMRDERISAALPVMLEEKSKIRYKAQFLLTVGKEQILNGAMALLRLANAEEKSNGKCMIGLTRAGVEFAKLPNPVLDENNYMKSLSQQEIDFYLEHVKKNVKSEFLAIRWMLEKISSGINERENINSELKKDFHKFWESSEAVYNTQRAGLMARMFELGLLDKEKNGIRVTYRLSEFGKSYLNKTK